MDPQFQQGNSDDARSVNKPLLPPGLLTRTTAVDDTLDRIRSEQTVLRPTPKPPPSPPCVAHRLTCSPSIKPGRAGALAPGRSPSSVTPSGPLAGFGR